MASIEPLPPHLKLGVSITLIACMFFASASALVSSFGGKFPTIQIIFLQNIVSLICILPLALRNGIKPLKTKELPTHLLRDLFGVGSYFLYFLAIRYLNLIDATTLNYTAPFFVPLIWLVWRNEKIQPNVWWAIVAGFIGVSVMLNPSKQIFQLGFLYGLFAGIASAIALAAVRVLNVKKEPLTRTLFYYFSIGTVLTLPFAAALWENPSEREWILAISIGVCTAVAQILLTIAYRYGTASYLSPLGYSNVIYNALISYFIFGLPLGWHSLAGAILIIVGGTMTFLFRKKQISVIETIQPPAKPPPL